MENQDLLDNDRGSASNLPANPPNSPEFEVINRPREVETEHVIVCKLYVDGKFFCRGCCMNYCHENGREFYESIYVHKIVRIDLANEMYRFENCGICSIGLMQIFGRRNCPVCRCVACNNMIEERCDACNNNHLQTYITTRRRKVLSPRYHR